MKIGARIPLIQLRNHFFPSLHVEADPKFASSEYAGKEFGCDFKIDVQVGDLIQADGVYPVVMTLENCEMEGYLKGYSLKLAAVGFFAIDSSVPEDKRQGLAAVNGGSILYGAAREYLLYVTSRGPYPSISLPTVSFYPEDDPSKATAKTKNGSLHGESHKKESRKKN